MVRLVAILLAGSAMCAPAFAQDAEFNGLVGTYNADTDGNLEMNGTAVTARGRIGGDLEMNGASVDVEAEVGGDAVLNGAGIEVRGSIAGSTLANGAGVSFEGNFGGPVEVNAAGVSLAGTYDGPVTLNVGGAELEGTFRQPVTLMAEGDGGWFRRGNRTEVEISGDLQAGGSICAHEVEFEPGARLGARLRIEADSEPEVPAGIDSSLIEFVQRQDRSCE